MRNQKLKVCGIELEPWLGENPCRLGPMSYDPKTMMAKVHILPAERFVNERCLWHVIMWDELKPFRDMIDTTAPNLTIIEAMDEVDRFLLRAERLISFQ